jgi:hypothetical protein
MKLVGVISDTHIPSRSKAIPRKALEALKNVDIVIHAGDLVCLEVIDELRKIAPVVAVHGNMDPPKVRSLLPKMTILSVEGLKIGVVHRFYDAEKLIKDHKLDVLVFGHSHRPFTKVERGTFLINPGSPTFPLPPLLVKPSVAVLKIREGKIDHEIIKL